MKKEALASKTAAAKQETHDALQTVVNELNKGQRKKLAKVEAVQKIADRFGVNIKEKN